MIGFTQAVRLAFQQYAKFSGRATRAEFWWFVLFNALARSALGIIDGALSNIFGWPIWGFGERSFGGTLTILYRLAVVIPFTALYWRRLHDINKTGWWTLLWLIGILLIPLILLLVWLCRKGDTGPNKYGHSLVSSQNSGGKFCVQCGSNLVANSTFCSSCGQRIDSQ